MNKKILKTMSFICIVMLCSILLPFKSVNASNKKPTKMTLNVSRKTIDVGQSYKIKIKSIKPKKSSKSVYYKSSNTRIATVSSKGIVRGKKEGKIKITVRSKKNKKLKRTVNITVKRLRPYSLKLNISSLNLFINDTYRLKYTVKSNSSVLFSSSNKSVATIDKNGKITPKKDGNTIITVKTTKNSYNGKPLIKVCRVNVTHLHHYVLSKVEKATCDKDGYEEYVCNICEKKSINKILATGHEYELTYAGTATCNKTDYNIYTCKKCGKIYKEELPKVEHEYVLINNNPATCKTNGYEEYQCRICKTIKKIELPKLEHDFSLIEQKNVTCEENGYNLYQCKKCNETKKEEIISTGHNYEKVEHKDADCEEDGYDLYICKKCKNEKKDIIQKLNHNFEYVKTVNPTCENDGYRLYICSKCNQEKKEKINKLGHDFTKKIEHKDSTCKEHGYDLYQCNRCEKTEKKELPFINHDFVKQKEDLEYIYYKCKNCGEEKKEYNDKEYTIDLGDGKTTTVFGHYNLTMPNELLELSNQEREIFDSNPLKMVKETCELQKIANLRAVELSYDYEKRHTRPNGEYVLDSFYDIDAENLTTGKDTLTSNEIFKTWMISPQHKETIINNGYRTIAISAFSKKRSNGTYHNYFVQLFSTHSLEIWNE